MSSSIKVTYDLKPPAGVKLDGLNAHESHEFSVQSSSDEGQKAYYTALQASIAKAKERIGNELTAWRDAVGKAELTKEPKQVKSDEEEEEEEDEQ
ncbi:hypothetical protein AN958_10946 [Leucoagaricus sp. SymC.cos]|nr:hypothetical protein AN958_10946 [Leucoagaricus sp. SymC.cos]